MPRPAKHALIAIGVLVSLLLIFAGIVAASFNPNDYKPLLIKLVQEKKHRTLAIPGDIKLTFFPKIGADLGKLSISEHKNPAEFAAVDSARVSLALIPLLSKQLVVDRILIDGLSANITRNKDGSTNFDDLLSQEESDQKIRFEIDSVSITNAKMQFDDRQQHRKLQIANLNVKTGKLANAVPSTFEAAADILASQPALDAKAKISGTFTFDTDKLLFNLPQLQLALNGKQSGAAFDVSLAAAVAADMSAKMIEVTKLGAAFTLPNPAGGTVKLAGDGSAKLDLAKQNVSLLLKGALDESAFDAKLGLTGAGYNFDLGIDRLDLDRYQAKPAAKSGATALATPEQPIDLSPLKNLNAGGSLRIAALKTANLKLSNVRIDLRAAGGKLDLNPISADLYGGSASGAASATAGSTPQFALRQNLSGINLGNLLRDAAGKDTLDGKGNVQLEVSTQGAAVSQMKKNLNGTARLSLHDGALRGVNLGQVLRVAKAGSAMLQGGAAPQSGIASSSEKTDFSELNASFRIINGHARNDDLRVKSPLIHVAGSGDINVGESRLDYLVKTSVAPVLQAQGGAELQALKGVTIPVKLSGPFSAIGWQVDAGSMAGELVKQKVSEKIQDQFKDQLKGLFGK